MTMMTALEVLDAFRELHPLEREKVLDELHAGGELLHETLTCDLLYELRERCGHFADWLQLVEFARFVIREDSELQAAASATPSSINPAGSAVAVTTTARHGTPPD